MARRTTGTRTAHAARRGAVRAANAAAASKCGSSGFNANPSAAWWATYYSPRAVAQRQKAAAKAARQQANAAKSFAAFAKSAGFKPTPFKKFTAAQWTAYFAAQCKPAAKPPRAPARPKPKRRSARPKQAGHRVTKPTRARPLTARPSARRSAKATRAVRARRR